MASKQSETGKFLERNAWTDSPADVLSIQSGVFLEILEHRYKKSNNPLYAWLAFQQVRSLDLAVPEWVLDYFDESADNLLKITGGLGDTTHTGIAGALGLKTAGAGTQFTRFNDEERNCQVYRRVQDLRLSEQFRTNKKINEMIGAEFGLTPGAVQKIFDNYSAFLQTVK